MKLVSPAFQFYPADFLADERVTLMTLEEIGAYMLALCYCWREGSIPNDDDLLARLFKGGSTTVVRVVKGCFNQSPTDASRLVHPRLEKEREKQQMWRDKSRSGGKKSAELRTKTTKPKRGKARVVQPPSNHPCKGGSTLQSSSSSSSSNSIPLSKARASSEQEVINYVKSFGLPDSDGSYLWNSWEAGGWKRGSEKIVDWKAAARTWITGGWLPSQKQKGGTHGQKPNSRGIGGTYDPTGDIAKQY